MKLSFLPKNRLGRSLRFLLIGAGAAGAVMLAYILILVIWYMWQPPTFKAYETSLQLNGSSLEKAELYYTDYDMGFRVGGTYKQTYDSGVVVWQDRFTKWRPGDCSHYEGTPADEVATECRHYDLGSGDAYRVVTRRKHGAIISLFISAKLGSTDLHISIPKDRFAEFEGYKGWEQYFKSMKSRSLLFTRYEYRPTHLRDG